jgi:hypothetical protein
MAQRLTEQFVPVELGRLARVRRAMFENEMAFFAERYADPSELQRLRREIWSIELHIISASLGKAVG